MRDVLPMTSILFITGRIYGQLFKCNYLRNKYFLLFVATYLKSTSNIEELEKKNMTLIGYIFSKLETAKEVAK